MKAAEVTAAGVMRRRDEVVRVMLARAIELADAGEMSDGDALRIILAQMEDQQ